MCRAPRCSASSTSISANPMIALSGVRSSCDMLARNVLLARLAASASSRVCVSSSLSRSRFSSLIFRGVMSLTSSTCPASARVNSWKCPVNVTSNT
jgi:hypothetical protein